jgi:hypothetical protein
MIDKKYISPVLSRAVLVNRSSAAAIIILLLSSLMTGAGCGNRAIFDELGTNRLKVVLKGTYETGGSYGNSNIKNKPEDWVAYDDSWIKLDNSCFDKGPSESMDDYSNEKYAASDNDPTAFMLDIAEMRLAGGDQDKFANYRKTFAFARTNDDPFFSGAGVLYKNDDPFPNYYYHSVNIFIRKMVMDGANHYLYEDVSGTGSADWVVQDRPTALFSEINVAGAFDFNQFQYNTYFDSLRTDRSNINRIFPIFVPIEGGLIFNNEDPETVLEIRIVVKNFIKRYEYNYTDTSGFLHAIHYWGLSDWLRDVKADDTVVGGNIIAIARTYVPGKTVEINGTAPATAQYVIAIDENDFIENYSLEAGARTRPAMDMPKPPNLFIPNDLETYLDYYLKYEVYKEQYNLFVAGVNDGTYASEWDTYETNVGKFKIPALVAYASGTYILENVPVGKSYKLYYTSVPSPTYGKLPDSFTPCVIALPDVSPVPITSDMIGSTKTVNCN